MKTKATAKKFKLSKNKIRSAIKKTASEYRKTPGQLANKNDNSSKESAIEPDIAAKTAKRFLRKNAELFERLC
jgi:FKBP-type peptidyl-prolyl cis-trans isomerase (trigger factor)